MNNDQVIIYNNTASVYPADTPVHSLIEAICAEDPDREAIRFHKESISYKKMNEIASGWAKVLVSENIKPGDKIGLSVDRSHNMLIALLAILKTGAAYIPLDPEYPEQRIRLMLEDAGAKMLITSAKYRNRYALQAREFLLEELMERADACAGEVLPANIKSDNLAYMIYTSGSTGKPKGVMLEHRNLVNFLYGMLQLPVMRRGDRLLAVTTISFDIAALELFLPLITGATVVIADTQTVRDGRLLLEKIQEEKISVMQATPVTWKMMLAASWKDQLPLTVLCGGEALSSELAAKLVELAGKVYNLYGPTETTVWSTAAEIRKGEKITVGKPIANTQIHILGEDGNSLLPGTPGEIYIGGDGVARGYNNMPALTAEKFVDDRFAGVSGKKMYRTGDLGEWTEDGNINFMGRIDQQIKMRGYRIEPGEIETALLAQPGVHDTVVIAREDTPGNKQLVAYIIPAKENFTNTGEPTGPVDSWRKALLNTLPDYMVPHEYVLMKEFPLLPNGKTNRNALPRPVKHSQQPIETGNKIQTSTEELVAGIWAEALGMEKPGLDENFFELGGHSLIAVQIMTRLEKETGERLPIAALFEAPTIRQLAAFIDKGNIGSSWSSLVAIKPDGNRPPLYIVHGDALNVMVFGPLSRHMNKDQPVFGLQARGLNGIEQPNESIEEIAADYIDEITRHNPGGPYCLAGYSFGGIVAFEMARQLEKARREVKLVALFDTNVGNAEREASGVKRLIRKIGLQFPKIGFIIRSFAEDPVAVVSYQASIVRRKWNAVFAGDLIDREDGLENMAPHEKEVILKHRAAYDRYIIKPYNGPVDLFKVKKRVYFIEDPVFLGWQPFATAVHVHEVPGDHRTFLLPPNDEVFANQLQHVIDSRIKEHTESRPDQ